MATPSIFRIPNVEDKRRREDYLKAEEKAIMTGTGIPADGLSPTGVPEITAGMSRNDAFFSKGRALDKSQLGGYKSFGDKSRAGAVNVARRFQGLPPIANTPREFDKMVNDSLSRGEGSALNTPEGRQRAISSGINAGLSAEESAARVQQAYGTLQAMRGVVGSGSTTSGSAPSTEAPSTEAPPTEASATPEKSFVRPSDRDDLRSLGDAEGFIEPTPMEEGAVEALAGGVRSALVPVALAAGAVRYSPQYLEQLRKTIVSAPTSQEAQAAKTAAEKAIANVKRLGGGATPKPGSPYEKATLKAAAKLEEALKLGKQAKAGSRAAATAKAITPVVDKIGKLAPAAGALKKVAAPVAVASEVVDAFRFFSPEQREKMTREVEAAAEKGTLRSVAGGVLSPTKTILGTGKMAGEALQAGRAARKAKAAADTAQRLFDARQAARRASFSDEEWAAMDTKDRVAYMSELRKRIVAR